MRIPFTNYKIEFQYYEPSQVNIVPKRYSDFLVDLNNVCAFSDSDVYLKREKEINQIYTILLKTINPNVILLGEHGVGKSATVQAVVHHVLKKKCPKQLGNCHFLYWDIEKMFPNFSSLDEKVSVKIKDSFDFIMENKSYIVLVIDQVHLMACSKLLIYYFTMLRKSGIRLIGMTTPGEFYEYFYDHKISATIDTISIQEPRSKDVYPMIQEYVKVLETRHGVKISEELINYTVSVSDAFPSELYNPGLAINFIERTLITAKRRKHKEATKKDVNSNFNFNYELFREIPAEEKKSTANHEAGHVIILMLSKNIRNYKIKAITIVPAEDFLGLTMYENEYGKQTTCDADYFKDIIALALGGRVAEAMLQRREGKKVKYTSGAYSDLKKATQTARDIVTEYGMIDSCGKNMTYFCNYDISDLALLSEQRKVLIDEATQKLIEEGYARAEQILTDNRVLLDLIAKELLEKEVLDEKDLERLCKKASES